MKLQRCFALMLVLLLVLSVLGGCNKSASNGDKTTKKQETKDVTVTVGFDQEPDTLDRMATTAALTRWVSDPVHDSLLTTDESGGQILPAVAKTWEYKSDTEVVFHLRDNVYFHNGRQLTADDVVFTIEYVCNQDNAAAAYSSIGPFVEKVEATGKFTVTIYLKEPYASLLSALTRELPIFCKEAMDTNATAPVGCGPFKFVKWDKNQQVVYEAFDKYYGEGLPSYKNLVFKFYSDSSTCLTAFLAGEVDIIHWVNQVDADTILGTGDSYLYEGRASYRYLTLNMADPVLSKPGVMKAISLAIDKQQIVDLVCAGYGEPVSAWVPHSSPYYPTDLDYERDVEQAKKLLADAGYPNGFKTSILAPQTVSEGGAATVIAQQLKDIGIEVELNILETPTFSARGKAKDYQLRVTGATLKGDPYMQGKYFTSDASNNIFNYSNTKYDELMVEACRVSDLDARVKIFNEAFEILSDNSCVISLFIENKLVALRKNMSGFLFRSGHQDYTRMKIE